MKKWVLLLLINSLCSCAIIGKQNSGPFLSALELNTLLQQKLLHDDLFFDRDLHPVIETIDLLTLPQATKNYLDRYVVGLPTEHQRYEALRQWVFDRFSGYQYDATETLSISNLVNDRKINCLSFSNLFIAAARYVDIPAQAQLVFAPPYWDAVNGAWVVNQHVNVYGDIKVEKNSPVVISDSTWHMNRNDIYYSPWNGSSVNKYRATQRYIADLNRAVVSVPFKTQAINDLQLLALFYNNKASEAIQHNQLSLAYAYIKAALKSDLLLSSVWNNLGVLYQRQNQLDLARQVYQVAIQLDDNAHSSKSNLSNVYLSLGELQKAEALEREVTAYREANPYYHYSLGEQSLAIDEYSTAADHFYKAIELKHNEQLFYYALAKTQIGLGNYHLVAENLKNARVFAKGSEKRRYSNKLKQFEQAIAANNK